MKCPNCGAESSSAFCPECGANVSGQQASTPPVNPAPAYQQPTINIVNTNVNTNVMNAGRMKNKWVAFVLCFFLGFVGAHKFYEGKGGMGVLYIFTVGLFGIGWLIDLIVILCKPNPYFV